MPTFDDSLWKMTALSLKTTPPPHPASLPTTSVVGPTGFEEVLGWIPVWVFFFCRVCTLLPGLDFLIFPTESTYMNLSLINPITCVCVCVCWAVTKKQTKRSAHNEMFFASNFKRRHDQIRHSNFDDTRLGFPQWLCLCLRNDKLQNNYSYVFRSRYDKKRKCL